MQVMQMERLKHSNKGVSMIMLVITIAMMAIIISFSVFSSKNITPEAKLAAAYANVKTVKDACDNALTMIEINPSEYDEYYFFGENIQTLMDASNLQSIIEKCGLTSITQISNRTYVINNSDSDANKRILERLELKGIANTYLVDLENEKYYILNGAERVDGGKVYEYKDILQAYDLLTK